MQSRAKRTRRLLDVLRQLHALEEQKKRELERRYQQLEQSQREAILALDTDDALHGLFVDSTARFLKSLAREAERVAAAHSIQSQRLLDRASKMKTAERLNDMLDRHLAQTRAERELNETIERYAGPRVASLP